MLVRSSWVLVRVRCRCGFREAGQHRVRQFGSVNSGQTWLTQLTLLTWLTWSTQRVDSVNGLITVNVFCSGQT
ncbi:hypothetical protein HanIR_Chr13g0626231 [Helianthus annuus]|nr:hypothetical protein HanIR_Chr13g0626231 [Helianthus annuus]